MICGIRALFCALCGFVRKNLPSLSHTTWTFPWWERSDLLRTAARYGTILVAAGLSESRRCCKPGSSIPGMPPETVEPGDRDRVAV